MNEEKCCYSCGNNYSVENGVKWGRYFYCDECFKRLKCNVDRYHNPSISTSFKKLDDEDTKEFLGIELETSKDVYSSFYNEDHVEQVFHIRKTYKDLELNFEQDGSIGNGIEIISQPMTMGYINKHKEDFKEILKFLQDKGYYSHNKGKCGLHIHVSKDFFGNTDEEIQSTIEKIMLFVETYQDKVELFSRRKHAHYNLYTKTTYNNSYMSADNVMVNDTYFKSGKMLYDLNKKLGIGHSSVVNTSTSSGNTIEFRMCRGTLKYETLMASIEFIHNLVNVCKENQASKISWSKVINFSGEFIKDYVDSLNIIDDGLYLRDYTKQIEEVIEKTKEPQMKILEDYKKNLDEIVITLQNIFDEPIDFTNSNRVIKDTLSFRQVIYSRLSNMLIDEIDDESGSIYDRLKATTKDYTPKCINNLKSLRDDLQYYSRGYTLSDTTKANVDTLITLINEKISKTNTEEC